MPRVAEPDDGDERAVTLGWLRFHRDALASKCEGLTPQELAATPCAPSKLSLLGLVRHLTEMERVYGVWALGPPAELECVYGTYEDGGPEWDFDVDASMADRSFANWDAEQRSTDARLDSLGSPEATGRDGGRSVRWSLQKLVGEYARHNGHADLIRERIDGATGE